MTIKRLIKTAFLWLSLLCLLLMVTLPAFSYIIKSIILSIILLVVLFTKNIDDIYIRIKSINKRFVIFYFVVISLLIANTYNNYQYAIILKIIGSTMNVSSNIVVIIFSIFAGIFSYYGFIYLFGILIYDLLKIRNINFKDYYFIKKPIIIYSIVYLTSIISIIRANYNYYDDRGRALLGSSGWGAFSRFLNDIISPLFHGNLFLVDSSPLTQIICIIILAISSSIVVYVFTDKKEYSFIEYCAVIPLALSPMFLCCISYKYDSPYMSLSILGSVFPILFYKKREDFSSIFVSSFIGILISCNTYQASTGIFPMIVIGYSLLEIIEHKNTTKIILIKVLYAAIGYICGMIFYRLFIMIPLNEYISSSLPPLNLFFQTTISNLSTYYSIIINQFNKLWLFIIAIIIVSSIAYLFIKVKKEFIDLLAMILGILLLLVLPFGFYIVLEETSFDLRSMFGFGVLLSIFSLLLIKLSHNDFLKYCIACISFLFFIFSFQYGNMLFYQNEFSNVVINTAIKDIDKDEYKNKLLSIDGSIPFSPIIENASKEYPLLKSMIPEVFRDNNWGSYKLFNYYKIGFNTETPNDYLRRENIPEDEELLLRENKIYYDIYSNEKYVLLKIK